MDALPTLQGIRCMRLATFSGHAYSPRATALFRPRTRWPSLGTRLTFRNPIPVEGRHLLQEIVILRCGCCNPYHSLARMIERREFPAAHKHELRPQPPVAIDPGADFMRIEPHQQPSAGPCRH